MNQPRIRLTKPLALRKGRYGCQKYKVFLLLDNNEGKTFSARELSFFTGISYHALGRVLPRWVEWKYLSRKMVAFEYQYKLLPKGQRWIIIAQRDMLMAERFTRELLDWLASIKGMAPQYMMMPWSQFKPTLDRMIADFRKGMVRGSS